MIDLGGGAARDLRSAFRLPMGEIGRGGGGASFSVGRERVTQTNWRRGAKRRGDGSAADKRLFRSGIYIKMQTKGETHGYLEAAAETG